MLPNVNVSKFKNLCDIKDIAITLQKINPGAKIALSNKDYIHSGENKIYSSLSLRELSLPKGFSYSIKNGLFNNQNIDINSVPIITLANINSVDRSYLVETGYSLENAIKEQNKINARNHTNQSFLDDVLATNINHCKTKVKR
jgi:hypothetical protein